MSELVDTAVSRSISVATGGASGRLLFSNSEPKRVVVVAPLEVGQSVEIKIARGGNGGRAVDTSMETKGGCDEGLRVAQGRCKKGH